jgi:hypothetical protein
MSHLQSGDPIMIMIISTTGSWLAASWLDSSELFSSSLASVGRKWFVLDLNIGWRSSQRTCSGDIFLWKKENWISR